MTTAKSASPPRLRAVRTRSDAGATALSFGYVVIGSLAAALGWAILSESSSSSRQTSRAGIIIMLAVSLWICGGARLLIDLGVVPRVWVWRGAAGDLVVGNCRAMLVRRVLRVPAGSAVRWSATVHEGIGLGPVGSGYVTLRVGERRLTLVTVGTDLPKLEAKVRRDLEDAGLSLEG